VEELNQIPARIRELREACDCPAAELAGELGIGEAAYLAYEQEGADVPISVLYHIARKFKVDFSVLATGKPSRLESLCVVRQSKAPAVDRYPGYSFKSLAGGFIGKVMEPLLVTVEPVDSSDPGAALVTHPGQEFNMVLSGAIEFLFGDRSVLLQTGDCVYFDPAHPHGQKAAGGQPATFLTVITE